MKRKYFIFMKYCLIAIFLITALSNIAQTNITVDKDYDVDPFLVTEHVNYTCSIPGGVSHPEVEGTLRFACAKANKTVGSCTIIIHASLTLHNITLTYGSLPVINTTGGLTGLTIDGTAASQFNIDMNFNIGQSILRFDNFDNIEIKEIGFLNFKVIGSTLMRYAIKMMYCNDVNLHNNRFQNGDCCIGFLEGENLNISNNIFNYNNKGIYVSSPYNPSENISISENQFYGSSGVMLGISICGHNGIISQNSFINLWSGILLDANNYVTTDKVQILNNTSATPFMDQIHYGGKAIVLHVWGPGNIANHQKPKPIINTISYVSISGTCENFDRVQVFKSIGGYGQDADWFVGEVIDNGLNDANPALGFWLLTNLNNSINNCFVAIATGNDPTTNRFQCSSELSNKVCFTTAPIPCNIQISSLTYQNDLCGNNGGEIHVTSIGGTLPLSYVLNGTDCQGTSINPITNLTGNFMGLGIGTYSVVATDANGCSASQSNIIIKTTTPVSYHLNVTDNSLCPGEATQVSCVVHENPVPECINYYLPNTTTCSWSFGAGANPATSTNCGTNTVSFSTPGDHIILLNVSGACTSHSLTNNITVGGDNCITCTDCIGTFAPTPGEKYIVSAWVKEDVLDIITYDNATIMLSYIDATGNQIGCDQLFAKGRIIDGWQKIDEVITIPALTKDLMIELKNNSTSSIEVYFDDIRIQPVKSNMKTYVYDPITGKLSAILDENNYATFYEYDEEGNLIRLKQETERGINTIQESRQNIHLNSQP